MKQVRMELIGNFGVQKTNAHNNFSKVPDTFPPKSFKGDLNKNQLQTIGH